LLELDRQKSNSRDIDSCVFGENVVHAAQKRERNRREENNGNRNHKRLS